MKFKPGVVPQWPSKRGFTCSIRSGSRSNGVSSRLISLAAHERADWRAGSSPPPKTGPPPANTHPAGEAPHAKEDRSSRWHRQSQRRLYAWPVAHEAEGTTDELTFDEELLLWLGDEPAGVRAADAERIRDIAGEFARGFDALARVGRAVTVFGSARTPREHPDYTLVREVGACLGHAGYAIITGGGPGLMRSEE